MVIFIAHCQKSNSTRSAARGTPCVRQSLSFQKGIIFIIPTCTSITSLSSIQLALAYHKYISNRFLKLRIVSVAAVMALLKAYTGLKMLCWQSTHIQQMSRGLGHLKVFGGLHKTRHYQRHQKEASTDRDHTVASLANRCTNEQDMSTDASSKNEDDGDVFGSLAKKSHCPKKFQLRKSTSWEDNHLQSKDSTSIKTLRNNKTYAVEAWPSFFGTLAEEEEDGSVMENLSENESLLDDEKEVDESEKPYRRLDSQGRKHSPHWYGRRIAKFGQAGKVHEAIRVLEVEMLKEDRVLPNQYVFTVLIGVLGRHGYTQKAFKLFNQMKKFGLAPQDPTYTALFNACSNSPWPEDGLKRANDLCQLMHEKEHQPNLMTYNAMVKAYAKCGDLRTSFAIVDEAITAGHKPDGACYSALLMACISDKEAGLKHAIEVWRVMRKRKVVPVTQHYNLLLRAVRDCSLGDEDSAQLLINKSPKSPSLLVSGQTNSNQHQVAPQSSGNYPKADHHQNTWALMEDSTASSVVPLSADSNILAVAEGEGGIVCGASVFDMDVPNLLNPRARHNNFVRLQVPTSSVGRLALLGGLPGILGHMTRDEATPDIKTFTLLLESIPSSCEAEADLIATMTLNKVKPDVDFCSLLIRKRNLRKDFEGAKDVLLLMDRVYLKPNIRTFGCLAMGCPEKEDAVQLFNIMEKAGLHPNTEIFKILMFQSDWNFSYKRHLLLMMKSSQVQPDAFLIQKLETKISKARDLILKKERGEQVPNFCRTDQFNHDFRKFMIFYKPWLLSTNLEPSVHPWVKFIQPTPVIPPLEGEEEDIAGSPQSKSQKVIRKRQQKRRFGV